MEKLYLRLEPAVDSQLAFYEPKHAGKMDVVKYRDKEAEERVSTVPWHHTDKPTKRNKYTMHNCSKYTVEWLEPLPPKPAIVAFYEFEGRVPLLTGKARFHHDDDSTLYLLKLLTR